MVLVDTSIWIRFLVNRRPFAAELEFLLGRDEVAGHELVYGELLIGESGGQVPLLRSYEHIRRLPSVVHAEVATFVRSHKLYGRGIGWIDAHLLASAVVADTPLWTADQHLARLAAGLGIAYQSRAT
ncbi:MAG: PIN domain-containing protein [Candidatus Solibacter sp.]